MDTNIKDLVKQDDWAVVAQPLQNGHSNIQTIYCVINVSF